jgi:hypothetical protein
VTLNYFKDKLFDLLNESEELEIADITTEDCNSVFTVVMADGSAFVIKVSAKES